MVEAVNAIELKNITKRFGEKVIANDSVNLTVRKGEILSLLGENGSGKTTLMNSILKNMYKQHPNSIKVTRIKNIYYIQRNLSSYVEYINTDTFKVSEKGSAARGHALGH